MAVIRFSAARDGKPGNAIPPWRIFGEKASGDLERDARAGLGFDTIFPQNGGKPFAQQPVFSDESELSRYFRNLPESALGTPDGPVVVFTHGFQFEVRNKELEANRRESANPHRRLFHFEEPRDAADDHKNRITPWLARTFCQQGIGDASGTEGLAVCFGYSAFGETIEAENPSLLDLVRGLIDLNNFLGTPRNFYALAYSDAMMAGHALAAVIFHLRQRLKAAGRDNQRIDIISHSLGTRTAMKAIETLAVRRTELGIKG